jgi:hypothetical protein
VAEFTYKKKKEKRKKKKEKKKKGCGRANATGDRIEEIWKSQGNQEVGPSIPFLCLDFC